MYHYLSQEELDDNNSIFNNLIDRSTERLVLMAPWILNHREPNAVIVAALNQWKHMEPSKKSGKVLVLFLDVYFRGKSSLYGHIDRSKRHITEVLHRTVPESEWTIALRLLCHSPDEVITVHERITESEPIPVPLTHITDWLRSDGLYSKLWGLADGTLPGVSDQWPEVNLDVDDDEPNR